MDRTTVRGEPLINDRFEKLVDRFWIGAVSDTRCIVPIYL
jgi:hypothetical protein